MTASSIRRALGFALAAGLVSGCVGGAAITGHVDQDAYNACVDQYNGEFRGLGSYRAIWGGASGSSSKCFWSWGSPNQAEATNTSHGNCLAEYSRCQLFATTDGMTAWARAISDNGGRAAGRDEDEDDGNGLAAGFGAGLAAGIGMGQALNRPRPSYGGSAAPVQRSAPRPSSGGSGRCPGATIAVDENCRPLH